MNKILQICKLFVATLCCPRSQPVALAAKQHFHLPPLRAASRTRGTSGTGSPDRRSSRPGFCRGRWTVSSAYSAGCTWAMVCRRPGHRPRRVVEHKRIRSCSKVSPLLSLENKVNKRNISRDLVRTGHLVSKMAVDGWSREVLVELVC